MRIMCQHVPKVCAGCLAASISMLHAACRRPPHEEDELLKQALLGADVEAPASSKKKPWCGFCTQHGCGVLTHILMGTSHLHAILHSVLSALASEAGPGRMA